MTSILDLTSFRDPVRFFYMRKKEVERWGCRSWDRRERIGKGWRMERSWLDSSPLVPRQSTSNFHVPGVCYQGLPSLCSAYFSYSFAQGFLKKLLNISKCPRTQAFKTIHEISTIYPALRLFASPALRSEVEWGWVWVGVGVSSLWFSCAQLYWENVRQFSQFHLSASPTKL